MVTEDSTSATVLKHIFHPNLNDILVVNFVIDRTFQRWKTDSSRWTIDFYVTPEDEMRIIDMIEAQKPIHQQKDSIIAKLQEEILELRDQNEDLKIKIALQDL